MTQEMTQDPQSNETKSQSAGGDATLKRVPVTLKDVAKRANVSPTTASLFFNGREDVCSKSTAVRLRQAASDLQYPINRVRHRAAGNRNQTEPTAGTAAHLRRSGSLPADPLDYSLRSRGAAGASSSYLLGVCIPHTANPTPSSPSNSLPILADASLDRLWRGISHVADVENCQILQYPRRTREGVSIEPFLNESRADGVIVQANPNDPRPAALIDAGMPVVLIGRLNDIPAGAAAVFTLESDTVDVALSHLWQLGHRRIAYLTGNSNSSIVIGEEIGRRRLDRYAVWTQIRGVYDEGLVFSTSDWDINSRGAIELLARIRAMPNCPTAIFCENDAIAVETCRAARAVGLEVPDDLSILGVGNTGAGAENSPSVSSVEIPYEELGVQAVVQLTRLLEGASPAQCRTVVPVTNLVARQSTGPLPQAGVPRA